MHFVSVNGRWSLNGRRKECEQFGVAHSRFFGGTNVPAKINDFSLVLELHFCGMVCSDWRQRQRFRSLCNSYAAAWPFWNMSSLLTGGWDRLCLTVIRGQKLENISVFVWWWMDPIQHETAVSHSTLLLSEFLMVGTIYHWQRYEIRNRKIVLSSIGGESVEGFILYSPTLLCSIDQFCLYTRSWSPKNCARYGMPNSKVHDWTGFSEDWRLALTFDKARR